MNAKRIAIAGLLAAVALAAVTGCSKKTRDILVPNLPPTVQLTAAPYDPSRATPYFYAYRMDWIGNDPDGRVDFFLYAVDPPSSGPINWTRTTKNEQIIFFGADSSDVRSFRATSPHIFAICCVDNRGDTSEVVQRGFFSYTQCPTVTITKPTPNNFYAASVTPSVRIAWTGADPDGQLTIKPVKYKWILLTDATPFTWARARSTSGPDSLRAFYGTEWKEHGLPGPWAGWDSTTADTTTVQFTNLTPTANYVFVVVSFDEAGAFSPIFSFNQNMLWFRPGLAATNGPLITAYNEFFVFQWRGGYSVSPNAECKLEVPANQRITFNWFADPPQGANIESYRWMLGGDPTDPTQRTRIDDFTHWSAPDLNTTTITVGPFPGGRDTLFYIEARDNNGTPSLAPIRMTTVQSSLGKDLLIVNDTRLIPERLTVDQKCLVFTGGGWPLVTELDSFFVARGGVPWNCTTGNSSPGLFAGYNFDVVRTATLPLLDKAVHLSTLGQYKNVVWIVDAGDGKEINAGPGGNTSPYSLRWMSDEGKVNTLGAYVRQGGHVWIAGGGGAIGLCKDLGDITANNTYTFTYSNRNPTELQPGRFMYDIAHWRSELQVYTMTTPALFRSARAVTPAGVPWTWTMPTNEFPVAPGLSAPDYTKLPTAFVAKDASDPVPATRTSNPSSFYSTSTGFLAFEFMDQGNFIVEDVNSDPAGVDERSVLDTLYRVSPPVMPGGEEIWEVGGRDANGVIKPGSIKGAPVMTYYHGMEFPRFVFTGFDIWRYRRTELVKLVDFVLVDIFGLPQPVRTANGISAQTVRGAPPVWKAPTAAPRTAAVGRAAPANAPAALLRPGSHDR